MKRQAFFSLDRKVPSFSYMKTDFRSIKELFFFIKTIPKVPISSYAEAIQAWGLTLDNPKDIKSFQIQKTCIGLLNTLFFFFLVFLFVFNFFRGTLGILPALEYFLALFATGLLGLLSLWQSDVVSSGRFLPFHEYITKGKWIFSCFFLFAFFSLDYSAVIAAGEIDLPNITINRQGDLSQYFIGSIVGTVWQDYAPGANLAYFNASSVLIPLLITLNMMALLFVTVFAVYIFTFGTVHIAQYGNWRDTQIFSTFWSPLRTSAAIVLCTPLGNGVSALHHLILLAVAMSINLANNISDNFINYLVKDSYMLQLSAPTLSYGNDNYPTIFSAVAGNVIMQKAFTNVLENTPDHAINRRPYRIEYIKRNLQNEAVITIHFESFRDTSFPSIVLKAYMVDGNNEAYKIIEAYRGATEDLISDFQALADKYIAKRIEDREKVTDEELEQTLVAMYNRFITSISKNVKAVLGDLKNKQNTMPKKVLQAMQSGNSEYGWLLLGTYPYALANAQGALQDMVKIEVSLAGKSALDQLDDKPTNAMQRLEMQTVKNFIASIDKALKNLKTKTQIDYGYETNLDSMSLRYFADKLLSYSGLKLDDIIEELQTKNPVAVMYSKGENIVICAALAITAFGILEEGSHMFLSTRLDKALDATASAQESKAGKTAGVISSLLNSKFTKGLMGAISAWMPLVLFVGGVLILFGLSCCYILPILPLLFWARAILSWAVLLVQTLIGAPFWVTQCHDTLRWTKISMYRQSTLCIS